MRILYIFPHPDDESFGPAAVIHSQIKNGHEVYLLTLTKGGATQQRHNLGLTVAEIGEVRYREMLAVEKVGVMEKIGDRVYLEIYGEDFSPPLGDLTD